MSEVFDPQTELDRIWSLRDVLLECRKRAPVVMTIVDGLLNDNTLSPMEKLAVCETVMNRGFGKPRQHHHITTNDNTEKQVRVYIPDNRRQSKLIEQQ